MIHDVLTAVTTIKALYLLPQFAKAQRVAFGGKSLDLFGLNLNNE